MAAEGVAGEAAGQVPFREALRVWVRVAALSFGGPAGQIAVMHRIVVEEKRWIGEGQFLHALNYCMLLPGPEAQQLATYLGWLLHGTRGGIVAGTLFILPGFVAILALSLIYAAFGTVDLVAGLFFGLKAAVLAIVLQAVLRIGRRALATGPMMGIAAAAFIGIFVFDIPFPLIILGAALIGLVAGRAHHPAFRGGGHAPQAAASAAEPVRTGAAPARARPTLGWSLRLSGLFLALWLGPVALLLVVLGGESVFSQLAVFFSKMAVVTFGGAYAVLAYVAQEAVQGYGWLRPGEMLDGLGMAETTPGPLIQVVQFVGFMAAWRDAGALDPWVAGTFAAVLTTWVTFVPCFLWIFLGAPFVEPLRGNRAISGALAAITAAVVGVILNLAIWFAIHLLFREVETVAAFGATLDVPRVASLDPAAALLTLGALGAIFILRIPMIPTLLGAAVIGMAWVTVAGG